MVTSNVKQERTLITKGALAHILKLCTQIQAGDESHSLDGKALAGIEKRYSDWSDKGFRVLGVATKKLERTAVSYSSADERDLTFIGFLLFFDPPKTDVQQAIVDLAHRGVQIKIITGDNEKVAMHVAEAVHLLVVFKVDIDVFLFNAPVLPSSKMSKIKTPLSMGESHTGRVDRINYLSGHCIFKFTPRIFLYPISSAIFPLL